MKLAKRLKKAENQYQHACEKERAHFHNGDYDASEAWFNISLGLLTAVKFYHVLLAAES